ncbi:ABC transporter permease [bacterium]|nr:ABC transporter permease [bacterium]
MTYLLQKVSNLIISVWGASTLVFVLLRLLPGDAVTARLASGLMSPDNAAYQRQLLGLNLPIVDQYIAFWRGALVGDFGTSYAYGLPAGQLVATHLRSTLELAAAAFLVALVTGMSAGIAMSSGRLFVRYCANLYLTLTLAMPIYWTGILAVFLFATTLDWFPATGSGAVNQLVIPAMVLGLHLSGSIGRVLASTLEDLQSSNPRYDGTREGVNAYHDLEGSYPSPGSTASDHSCCFTSCFFIERYRGD